MRICEKGHLVATKKCWCGSQVNDVLGGRCEPIPLWEIRQDRMAYLSMRNFRGMSRSWGRGGAASPQQKAMSGGK